MKDIKLFVPGRLCLFGEHSDWTSSYKKYNKSILDGKAIVTCIDKGIYAAVNKADDKIIVCEGNKRFEISINLSKIKNEIKKNSYNIKKI